MPEDKKTDTQVTSKDTPEVKDWTGYAATLPKGAKALHDAHYAGLVSGHERVKTERNDLKAALKNLKGAKGEERDAKIKEIQAALDASEKTNKFHESCPADIVDRKAALALAGAYGCIKADGKLDADKLRKDCPMAFGKPVSTRAGDGARNKSTTKGGHHAAMDQLIRDD